jgi:uncharacterized repeat protein (TIGR01451 family)
LKRFPALLLAIFLFWSGTSQAAGTNAGTLISNSAVLQCDLCGPGGSTSNVASFVVDNKVNVVVAETDGAATPVIAGQTAAVAAFTVTNQGNAVQDFALAAANIASGATLFGGIDNFDTSACIVRVESGLTPGFDPTDSAAFIDELDPDSSRTAYVVCNVPAGVIAADLAIVSLTAMVLEGGAPGVPGAPLAQDTGADDPASVQVVFADAAGSDDAARDGRHSARDAYRVGALLTLTKSVTNVQDPFGCSAASGCRIVPGAILTYRIDVIVGGSGTLDDLVLSDPIPANMSYLPGSLVVDGTPHSDAADSDEADFGITAPNTVTVSPGNVSAPLTSWFSFRALIN